MRRIFSTVCFLLLVHEPVVALNSKIASNLQELVQEYKTNGVRGARNFSLQRKMELSQENSIEVILELEPGTTLNPDLLKPYNAEIKNKYSNLTKIKIPIDQLDNVANTFSQVNLIRLPFKPHPLAVVSQGVNLTGTDIFQSGGYKGAGTKIAVIDGGFAGYTNAQSAGDLPSNLVTYDYTGTGMLTGAVHGTAVAEIIYDMAPEANLYLMKIADEVDIGNATANCKLLGINIINHCQAWYNTGPGDGTGTICDIANDAYNNGILWVNAAGNYAQQHWQGKFVDNNSNTWLDFTTTDESNTINISKAGYISICMRWNDSWNNSRQDYDLYLYNSSNNLVASSKNRQIGLSINHPIEEISYNAQPGSYRIKVKNYNATGNNIIELLSADNNFTYFVSSGSISEPADSPKVLSVGAISCFVWASGPRETFSSMGPTKDGRIKPDICGPDRVQTYSYGSFFAGTSAAAPHIAGAASLLFCRNASYKAADVWNTLEQDAIDMGDPGKDNSYGSGRLVLKTLPPDVPLNPKCNGQTNPNNINTNKPGFSWVFNDPELPDDGQKAYQLIVSSVFSNIESNTGDTGDSGKVISANTQSIYNGNALSAWTTYYWKIRTWDKFDSTGPYCSTQNFKISGPSPVPVVRDGINPNEDITLTFSSTALAANWNPATDIENGITGYQYAIGTTKGGTNIANWITLGNVLSVLKNGLTLTAGTTYYFSVQAINAVGLKSSSATNSNGQFVVAIDIHDTTPPGDIATVRDGIITGTDISVTRSTTQLSANWTPSADNESGVSEYWYAISSSVVSGQWLVGWTNNGPAISVTKTGLNLTDGTTYYFSVKARNGVGLESNITFSAGQCLITLPVILGNITVSNITSNSAIISWVTDKITTTRIEYGQTANYGNLTVADNILTKNHTVELPGLLPATLYHFRVKSDDGSGNEIISEDNTFTTLQFNNPAIYVYPNPFIFANNQKTKFRIDGTEGGLVKIFTLTGDIVKQLRAEPGINEIEWDGKNETGDKIAAGIYLCTISSPGNPKRTVKLAVVR